MKRLFWISLLLIVGVAPIAHTQDTTASLNADRAKQVLTTARRDIFEATMGLTDAQKDPFWNIYNEYEKDRAPVTEKTLQLVQQYTADFSTLTNEQLMKMMKDSSSNAKKQIDLRTKYAEQMCKKVDPKVGVRFFQIDDYITTAVRLDVLDNIPFVGGTE